MVSGVRRLVVRFFLGMAFLGVTSCLCAQGFVPARPPDTAANPSRADIPDAPSPQIELALPDPRTVDPQSAPAQNPPAPATGTTSVPAPSGGSAQSNSSSQNSAQQPNTQETQHQKAEEQVKEQEHQRMAGIVPSFNVSYRSDAVPLTPAEKFKLEFRAAIDPYTFTIATIVAGPWRGQRLQPRLRLGPRRIRKTRRRRLRR